MSVPVYILITFLAFIGAATIIVGSVRMQGLLVFIGFVVLIASIILFMVIKGNEPTGPRPPTDAELCKAKGGRLLNLYGNYPQCFREDLFIDYKAKS